MVTSRKNELNEYWKSVFEGKDNISQQEKLAELIKQLKEQDFVNKHGVYINIELIPVPLPKSLQISISIKVAQGADGKWRYGIEYENRKEMYGHGRSPNIFDDGYDSRNDAILAVVETLKERYKDLNPYLDDFITGLNQLTLF